VDILALRPGFPTVRALAYLPCKAIVECTFQNFRLVVAVFSATRSRSLPTGLRHAQSVNRDLETGLVRSKRDLLTYLRSKRDLLSYLRIVTGPVAACGEKFSKVSAQVHCTSSRESLLELRTDVCKCVPPLWHSSSGARPSLSILRMARRVRASCGAVSEIRTIRPEAAVGGAAMGKT
jgi:hypothetical protein